MRKISPLHIPAAISTNATLAARAFQRTGEESTASKSYLVLLYDHGKGTVAYPEHLPVMKEPMVEWLDGLASHAKDEL